MTESNLPTPDTFVVEIPQGVLIREPRKGQLVKTGDVCPRTLFWNRLLASGQVKERVEPPAKSGKSKE